MPADHLAILYSHLSVFFRFGHNLQLVTASLTPGIQHPHQRKPQLFGCRFNDLTNLRLDQWISFSLPCWPPDQPMIRENSRYICHATDRNKKVGQRPTIKTRQ
jgi:hypothetical protein